MFVDYSSFMNNKVLTWWLLGEVKGKNVVITWWGVDRIVYNFVKCQMSRGSFRNGVQSNVIAVIVLLAYLFLLYRPEK